MGLFRFMVAGADERVRIQSMATIVEFADYAGSQRRHSGNAELGTGEVIIFPGVRIDYSVATSEDNPGGPSQSPRRERRRDA